MAYANLADVYREIERDNLGEKTLNDGLILIPNDLGLHAAMGLLRTRQRRIKEAKEELRLASALDPEDGWYGYLYASALRLDDVGAARAFLIQSQLRRHDRAELYLLIQLLQQEHDTSLIKEFVPTLSKLAAEDARAQQLFQQLSR